MTAGPMASGRNGLRTLGIALALGALAAAVVLVATAEQAEANHLRGGTLHATPTGGNSVLVEGRFAQKCITPPCDVGSIVSVSDSIFFGDGNSVSPYYRITYRNTVEDYFEAVITDSAGVAGIPHTYASALDPSGMPW